MLKINTFAFLVLLLLKMKRFLHIIIAGLFLFTTTGFTISKHYCAGDLVDVAINATPESCCDEDTGSCCSDESETFQLTEVTTLVQSLDVDSDLSFNIFSFTNILFEANTSSAYVSNSILKTDIPPPLLTAFLADIQSFRL